MRRLIALALSTALALPGCASHTVTPQTTPARNTDADRQVLVSYVMQLAVGSRVKVTRMDGHDVRGTLMKATEAAVIVQRRTRVPEPPVTVPLEEVRAVEIEPASGNAGRTIAIGVAAGAGAALGVLLILAAIFADD